MTTAPIVAAIPPGLTAIGASSAPFAPMLPLDELPAGSMRRVSVDDLDVLLAHTSNGIVAIDDRCPHMSAPLSIGQLDGCLVACPLHSGQFDLATGSPTRMPPTGGLGVGAYQLKDNTGTITVVSDQGSAPRKGSDVAVKGKFESLFSIGRAGVAVIREESRDAK